MRATTMRTTSQFTVLLLALAKQSFGVPVMADNNYIFGGDKPWDAAQFTAVDDTVRGGASVSHLTVNADRTAATFYGTLDTKTLGGAGFASQRTVDPFLVDLTGVDALVAEVVVPADNKTYTLTLKNEILPPDSDGREQSTVSWEYDFRVPSDSQKDCATEQIRMPISQFNATYRGRPVEDAQLDLANIKRISFMMRSFFDQQDGDFNLTIKSLAAPKSSEAQVKARRSEAASEEAVLKPIDTEQVLAADRGTSSWRRWLCNW